MARTNGRTNNPRCAICKHPNRALIERAHVAGASLNAIASKYEITRDAVWNHCKKHMSPDMRAQYLAETPLAELVERAAEEKLSLIDYLVLIRGVLVRQFQECAAVGDRNGTALMAARLLQTSAQIGTLTGEMARLGGSTTINNTAVFMNSPVFSDLHAMLIRRLRDYPDAWRRSWAACASLRRVRPRPSGKTHQ
jgi:hypothetical protein